jgi:hypothetical protein
MGGFFIPTHIPTGPSKPSFFSRLRYTYSGRESWPRLNHASGRQTPHNIMDWLYR